MRQLRQRMEGDMKNLREQLREERGRNAVAETRVMEIKEEKEGLTTALETADNKVLDLKEELDDYQQKLGQITDKFEM